MIKITGLEVSKQLIFLASIDVFLQNLGPMIVYRLDSIEYLVSISTHPYGCTLVKDRVVT